MAVRTSPPIQEIMTACMKHTGNPVAPIILQEMATAIHHCEQLVVPMTDKENVKAIIARLLKDFADKELDENGMKSHPEFILALTSMLHCSLTAFPKRCHDAVHNSPK